MQATITSHDLAADTAAAMFTVLSACQLPPSTYCTPWMNFTLSVPNLPARASDIVLKRSVSSGFALPCHAYDQPPFNDLIEFELGPVTMIFTPFFKGRIPPSFLRSTSDSDAALREADTNCAQPNLSYFETSQVGLSNRPRRYFIRRMRRTASSTRLWGIEPSFTRATICDAADGS